MSFAIYKKGNKSKEELKSKNWFRQLIIQSEEHKQEKKRKKEEEKEKWEKYQKAMIDRKKNNIDIISFNKWRAI